MDKKHQLSQARALDWALRTIYQAAEPQARKLDIDDVISACVGAGLEVAFVTSEAARMLPTDAHSHWFGGQGWYVDTQKSNPGTLPIGPFDTAADAWREAYMAYALGGSL